MADARAHAWDYGMADDPWVRTVECKDFNGRPKALKVFLSDKGQIVIQAPPGETAALSFAAVGQLKEHLDELTVEAFRRASTSGREQQES